MVDVILALPEFAYLAGKFENRRNPLATKFHYALASLEDQLLQESLNELREDIPGLKVNTLMFDGATVLVGEDEVPHIRRILKSIGSTWGVTFSIEVD